MIKRWLNSFIDKIENNRERLFRFIIGIISIEVIWLMVINDIVTKDNITNNFILWSIIRTFRKLLPKRKTLRRRF